MSEQVDETRLERRRRQMETTITRAAADLLAEEGLNRLSFIRVAERADVAVGTVYNHFADVDELLSEVATRLLPDLDDPGPRSIAEAILEIGRDAATATALSAAASRIATRPVFARWLGRDSTSMSLDDHLVFGSVAALLDAAADGVLDDGSRERCESYLSAAGVRRTVD